MKNTRILLLMVSLISTANGMGLTAPLKLPGGNTVLCGAKVYSDLWGATDEEGNFLYPITAGIYTIEAKPGGEIKRIISNQDLIKLRAGVKVNSLYYAISTSDYDTSAQLSVYYTSSWNRRSVDEIDVVNVPSDMTYDPVSGNVYGFFWNDAHQEYDRFCRFDTYYGEAQDISLMDRNCFAIAANAKGEIYGIWGYTGWLIKINPANGRYEQIGKTGFSPGYINSLAFDDATGKLYWTANDNEGYSCLLEVNTETGQATEIMHFNDNDTYAGIFAMPYKVPDAAPAIPTDITAAFTEPGGLQCTVSCTAPSKTYNGATLEGPLTLVFAYGNQSHEVTGVTPGAQAVSPAMSLQPGFCDIAVTAATETLLGAQNTVTVWAGHDVPGAPADVTLSETSGKPHLTWTAPTEGLHNGYFDSSALQYRVKRYPDGKTFNPIPGIDWTDTDYDGHAAALQYGVTAVGVAGESTETLSPKVVFGDGYNVPFNEGFATADDFNLWTIFDLNGQSTWEYSSKNKNIFYSYSREIETPGDDWIISPKFPLEAGKTYRLSADVSTYYRGYPENFRFALGTACNPEAMTQTLLDCPDFENPTGETKRATFSVRQDGYYHLGLYAYSIAHNWQLTVDNIGIEEISGKLPASVTGLSADAAPEGALQATLHFAMPTKASDGTALTQPLEARIYIDHSPEPSAVLTSLTPGQPIEWTDNGAATPGLRHYRVTAASDLGEGGDASAEIWVGLDIPGAVRSLTAVEEPVSVVTLTWEAPAEGAHGGWFGDSQLLYRIVRSDGEVLAEATTELTFTDSSLPRNAQCLVYYLVTPYSNSVKGQYAVTPTDVYGPAVKAPVSETFPNADMTNYPWVSESNGPVYLWSLEPQGANPPAIDQNGDKGMAMFVASQQSKGITGTLSSPKFDIAALPAPMLSFWMFHSPDASAQTCEVLVKTHDTDFSPCEGGVFQVYSETPGWQRHSLSLARFAGAGELRLQFKATATEGGTFYIDNIGISENRNTDISLSSLTVPAKVARNLTFPIEVTVENLGSSTIPDAEIEVRNGNNILGKVSVTGFDSGCMANYEIPVSLASAGTVRLTATVTANGDEVLDNNTISENVTVVEPIVPAPKELRAGADTFGGVSLMWMAPGSKAELTDDFEAYPDWAVSGFGGYRMFDFDGDNTFYIHKDLEEYPDCQSPKAWQICNAKTLGIDIWPEGTPNSGNKMLMAIASVGGANNDWIVTPRLNGAAQTMSFFAKAFTAQDTPAERMRVMYSDTDCSPASFKPLHAEEFIEVPDSWTEYSWALPEGAKWAAINCVSRDAFALFVDDLSFNDLSVLASPVKEYIVWRNGTEVARTDSPGYNDPTPENGKNKYQVQAMYADGTLSPMSNRITVEATSGLQQPAGTDGEVSETFTLEGIKTTSKTESLPTGVYIRRSSKGFEKILKR